MTLAAHRLPIHKNLDGFREWSAKFRHWMVDIAESDTREVWICVDHLREFHPGLPDIKMLIMTYRLSMFYVKDGKRHFISESGMRRLIRATAKSHEHTDALRFLDWYERNIAQFVVKKRTEDQRVEAIETMNALKETTAEGVAASQVNTMVTSSGQAPASTEHPAKLNWREWWVSQYNDLHNIIHGLWHGDRNIVLTYVAGLMVGFLPMYFFDSILSEDLDWAESYRQVLMWNFLALPLAVACAIWFGVTMTRSLRTSFKKPSSVIWTLPFYLFTIGTVIPIACNTWSSVLLEESWDIMFGRYKPADVYVDPYLGRIVIKGQLKFGSSKELERVLAANRKLTLIEIESPGGFVVEGLRMAKSISDRKLDTMSFDHCESACTLLLASGKDRYLGPEVGVGFHRSGARYGSITQEWSPTDHQMAKYLRSRGVNEQFIRTAFLPSIQDIWYAPHGEMYSAGYATSKWSDRKFGY